MADFTSLEARLVAQERREKAQVFSTHLKDLTNAIDKGIALDKGGAFIGQEWDTFRTCVGLALLHLIAQGKGIVGDTRDV